MTHATAHAISISAINRSIAMRKAVAIGIAAVWLVATAALAAADTTNFIGRSHDHANIQPSLVINHLIALEDAVYPPRDGSTSGDAMIGEIVMFAGNFAPSGWAFADGQILPIQQNASLFTVMGTTYGGDGRTTFKLPDLRGRTAVGEGNSPDLSDRRLGQRSGAESVTMRTSDLPAHSHALPPYAPRTENSGSGESHYNIQPSLALNYTIATTGLYPDPNSGSGNGQTYIGEIRRFAGSYAPGDSEFTDGQLMSIGHNLALFSLLGTTYGGDGRTTFAMPDLRGRTPVGQGQAPGLMDIRIGQRFGQDAAPLTENQMPSHEHAWVHNSVVRLTGPAGGAQPNMNTRPHSNHQPSLGMSYIISLDGNDPSDPNVAMIDHFMGEVSLFGGTFAPRGWAFAQGQLLAISQYSELFGILSTTYGGDGTTTFALPDLRGRTAVHEGQAPGLTNRTLGQKFGAETATLTELQMTQHNHVTPEPATMSMLALGGLAMLKRRGKRRS